ncbi:MAG TPA: phosphatidylinositol mannoside acyltransferase [Jatrophihabitantaceae bacterium]|jgi:KDO2-lipid IV(A) lauroyltransferase|nr:phosphatidylinositol mannoside acyltransferase [Jatrophihabitantaceae bacterium]
MFERVRAGVADLGYAAGWSVVKSAPTGLSERAFRAAADAAAVRNGGGTRQLRKNLRRVVGPAVSELRMDQLVGDALRSYSRYWLETFRLPRMDHADVIRRTDANTTGAEHIDAAVDAGRGFILALPHIGNWDVAGLWLIDRYQRPFTTVAERLKPESLYDRFVAYREGLGFEVLPLTGGERSATSVLTERLQAGGGVCLLGDRDLSRNGVEVQFFGEAAKMPPGPALLAATTGAALIPVSMWFTEDGWGQRIDPPIELGGPEDGRLADRVRAGTQRLADAFAEHIAAHPIDWHMLQRLWLADLPPRPDASAAPLAPAAAV